MTDDNVVVVLRDGRSVTINWEGVNGDIRLTAVDDRGNEVAHAFHGSDDQMSLDVAGDWCDRGLGTQLLARLAASARSYGRSSVRTLVPAENGQLIKWLGRRGGQIGTSERDGVTIDVDVDDPRIPRCLIGSQPLHWLIELSRVAGPFTAADVHSWEPIRALLARAYRQPNAVRRILGTKANDLCIVVEGQGMPLHWLSVDRTRVSAMRFANPGEGPIRWKTFLVPEVVPVWNEHLEEALGAAVSIDSADVEELGSADMLQPLELSQRGLILDRPWIDPRAESLWPGEVYRCCLVPGEGGAAPLLIVWLEIGATRVVLAAERPEGPFIARRRDRVVTVASGRLQALGIKLQIMAGQLFR